MKKNKIKLLIAGAVVSAQLFGPSTFSLVEKVNAAELGENVSIEQIIEQIDNDEVLSLSEKEMLNEIIKGMNNINLEYENYDSEEEVASVMEEVDDYVTTQAAVSVNIDSNVDYLNINLDDIHISEDNYVEDMKNIVEPYIDSRKETGYITGVDNAQLYYEKYYNSDDVGNIVISHGFTENLEKYNEMIYYFLKNGYNVFGIEHRGHGRSGSLGVKDPSQIHVNDFNDYVKDLKTFMNKIVMPNSDGKKVFLYAHSMGGRNWS